jgi:hypothetical protein
MRSRPKLFCFWTENNSMSNTRKESIKMLRNTTLDVTFIDSSSIQSWEKTNFQLHKAYPFLSAVHKSDYLRCYFMHHYGGGYSDIKPIQNSWSESFDRLMESKHFAIGYKETSPFDIARGRGFVRDAYLAINYFRLIGNGAFIFKPNTEFTFEWIERVHFLLDSKFELLSKFPATHPRDYYQRNTDGQISKYPLAWSELLGQIFHPLCLKHSSKILKTLPKPDFNLDYL